MNLGKETNYKNFLKNECTRVAPSVRQVCLRGVDFVKWLYSLEAKGPGQDDPLFDWIANYASRAQLEWFVKQELMREGSYSQNLDSTMQSLPSSSPEYNSRQIAYAWEHLNSIRYEGRALVFEGMLKLIISEATMLDYEVIVPESSQSHYLMEELAAHPSYWMQSVGALSMRDICAQRRIRILYQACRRLGLTQAAALYHSSNFSKPYDNEALSSVVRENPLMTQALAEGAWLSLQSGAQCFERYRKELFYY